MPKGASHELMEMLRNSFKRQALHAASLALIHPHSSRYMEWDAPLPDDFQHLLTTLQDNETTNS